MRAKESQTLVLSRRPGEEITIGDVVVHVVEIHGGRVRLAITAPMAAVIACDERNQKKEE